MGKWFCYYFFWNIFSPLWALDFEFELRDINAVGDIVFPLPKIIIVDLLYLIVKKGRLSRPNQMLGGIIKSKEN